MPELAAVIIETRNIEGLNSIVNNHMDFLPSYTKLYHFGNEPLTGINYNYNFIKIESKLLLDEYNYFLTSLFFWNKIEEENVLIFQHDSIILRNNIEDFYEFDFIGAPIAGEQPSTMNGGLSFRHKSSMIEVLKNFYYDIVVNEHEDGFFCRKLKELGMNKAIDNFDNNFCVDNVFKLGSFGVHGLGVRLKDDEYNTILNQYK